MGLVHILTRQSECLSGLTYDQSEPVDAQVLIPAPFPSPLGRPLTEGTQEIKMPDLSESQQKTHRTTRITVRP